MSDISRRQFFGTGRRGGARRRSRHQLRRSRTPPRSRRRRRRRPRADETLALVNGRIHTMDGRNTVARVVTIRNGRFISVGDSVPRNIPNLRTIDLGGRTVVPGLIEPHVHIVSLANRPGYHTILENTNSIREIQETLCGAAQERAERPVDHLDGRLAPEPVVRAAPPDPSASSMRRSPTGRCCSTSGSPDPRSPTVSARSSSTRWTPAPPVHPDIKPVGGRRRRDDCGRWIRRRRARGQRAVPPAPDADSGRQGAQHAGRDERIRRRWG